MTTTETDIAAPPDEVFAVISEPRTYPAWLPGAQHIRRVEPGWPEPGASFHHTVGAGPLHIRDATTVLDAAPPDRLTLRARVGPLGAALVRFTLTPTTIEPTPAAGDADGDPGPAPAPSPGTHVVMDEIPERGVLRNLWNFGGRHLLRLTIWGRNRLALDQLRAHIEGGGHQPSTA